jgi:hypothetical protein
MVTWTPGEQLTFDIAFALKKATIPGFRKALTKGDRISIAKVIIEHLIAAFQFFELNGQVLSGAGDPTIAISESAHRCAQSQ